MNSCVESCCLKKELGSAVVSRLSTLENVNCDWIGAQLELKGFSSARTQEWFHDLSEQESSDEIHQVFGDRPRHRPNRAVPI